LLHQEKQVAELDHGLEEVLFQLKDKGLARFVGVSVYTPSMAFAALQHDVIDMVQLPSSIVDQRFLREGIFDLAREKGKKIFVRSVFLQGLLMMNRDDLVESMQFAGTILEQFDVFVTTACQSKHQLALGFVKQAFPEAYVLFGAESVEQVKENSQCWQTQIPDTVMRQAIELFGEVEEQIVNPALWPV